MTTTRKELIADVAEEVGISKAKAGEAINAFLDLVTDSLAQGEDVSLRGFGNFGVRHMDPRIGRNPQTGEEVEIPAHNKPYFRPSALMKDLVK